MECRLVEMAVVVDPAPEIRVVLLGQVSQGQVAPSMQGPSPDRLPDCFQCLRTGCRQERDRVLIAVPYRLPRPERIAEKVERLVRKVASPVRVLAVDELRLLRVQSELASCKSSLQAAPQRLGLFGALAMTDDVVRVSLERNAGIGPRHPRVEDIVQEQVRQSRTYQPSHNVAKLPFDLSVRVPRKQLRPGYGEGFLGAPVVICPRSGESRSGCGGADDPARRDGSESDGAGEL